MRASRYFAELYDTYAAEVSDQRTDSEGKDVFRQRLAGLRSALDAYLPMMDCNPEMVTVLFCGAFDFGKGRLIEAVVSAEPDDPDFPVWEELQETLVVAPWAQDMTRAVLANDAGSQFLVIAAGLEYLRGRDKPEGAAPSVDDESGERRGDEDDEDGPGDLGEAGSDWLTQQGFDPKP